MFGWIKTRVLSASPLTGRGAESGWWQIGAIGGLLLLSSLATHAVAACDWPEWQQFKQQYISEQGRVIDPSSPKKITTSEGQSYGLFFALVANDRAAFDNILQWTQNNLAQGDLSARLPAWLWGMKEKNQEGKEEWGVLDTNSASDSDLWIAYSLMEAGRLWKVRSYQSLGVLLLQRIAREEVAELPGFGVMLLPGRVGFSHPPVWTVNPSYLPPQLMARMAHFHGPWAALHKNNQRLLLASSPKGFVPDWIDWRKGKGWEATPDKPNVSGYDAIRVYLWAGMMADEDPSKAALIKQWQPMATMTAELGYPPERVNVATGKATGYGNSGFSAALLPFLAGSEAQAIQRQRVKDNPLGDDAYYSYVLTLFGQGWDQQRYRFNLKGELLPHWDSSTCVSIATSH